MNKSVFFITIVIRQEMKLTALNQFADYLATLKMLTPKTSFVKLISTLIYFIMFLFRKDSFTLTCATSLGRLTKVRIGHDNTGFGAAWFLDKVSLMVFI